MTSASKPANKDNSGELGSVFNLAEFVLGRSLAGKNAPVGFNNAFPYTIYLYLGDTQVCSPVYLVHNTLFTADELTVMTNEVSLLVLTLRIAEVRRQAKIPSGITPEQIAQINRDYFQGHIALFKGMMCDKYNFRLMTPPTLKARIEETIKGHTPVKP